MTRTPSPTKTPTGLSVGDGATAKDHRQMCKYGENCYQKNPMHHQKFRHPAKNVPKKQSEEEVKKDKVETVEDKDSKAKDEAGDKENEAKAGDNLSEEADGKEAESSAQEPPSKKAKMEAADDEAKIADELDKPFSCCDEQAATVFDDGPRIALSDLASLSEAEKIKKVYGGLSMPADFFEFWKFCQSLNRTDPLNALVHTCGLRLVGPFELLRNDGATDWSSNGTDFLQNDALCHHRYRYDPPELQTVMVSVNPQDSFHLGYFRDDPKELPAFVSGSGGPCKEEKVTEGFSNHARITLLGDNLFGAVYNLIKKFMHAAGPFKQTAIAKLKESLHCHATVKNQENDFSLEVKTAKMKSRDKMKLSQTFHGAGLVVPYDKKTQVGYREIPETTASLKKILRNVVEAATEEKANATLDVLQELITNVQFANDEGDPGMGLELGINAFLYGPNPKLDSSVKHLMGVAYELLNRDIYQQIMEAHLIRRKAVNNESDGGGSSGAANQVFKIAVKEKE